LYGGILLFMVSFSDTLAHWMGLVLDYMIQLLNYLIVLIEQIPYSLLKPLVISIPAGVAIYGIILCLTIFLVNRKLWGLYAAMGLLAVSLGWFSWQHIQHQNNAEITVYKVPGNTAVSIFLGKNARILAGKDLLQNDDKMLFHIMHHFWYSGINEIQKIPITGESLPKSIHAGQYGLYFIRDQWPQIPTQTDYCIISANTNIKPNKLKAIKPGIQLILDSSLNYYQRKKWKEAAAELGVRIYDVQDEGAWVLKFKKS
jgi:competence protein ComEC